MVGGPRLDPGPSEWLAEAVTGLTAVGLPREGQRSKFSRRLAVRQQFKGLITIGSPGVRPGSRLD